MKIALSTAAIAMLSTSVLAGAQAAVTVFTNFSGSPSFDSGNLFIVGSPLSGAAPNVVQAMPFAAGATADLEDAVLALTSALSSTNSPITVYLESNASGQPGAILATLTQAGTIPVGPPGLVTFNYSGAPVGLAAGAQYWLVALQPDVNSSDAWFLSNGDTGTNAANVFGSSTGPWTIEPGDRISAFQVDGTAPGVPEPSTWAMMALGFGLMGLLGYRKTRGALA
jgi:hypothetical protein